MVSTRTVEGFTDFKRRLAKRRIERRQKQAKLQKERKERRQRESIQKELFRRGIPTQAETKGGVGADIITTKFVVVNGKRVDLERIRRKSRVLSRPIQRVPVVKPAEVRSSKEVIEFAKKQKIPLRQISREGVSTVSRTGDRIVIKKEDISRAKRLLKSRFVSSKEKKDVKTLAQKVAVSRVRQEKKESLAIGRAKNTLTQLSKINKKINDKVRVISGNVFDALSSFDAVPPKFRSDKSFAKKTFEETSVLINQVFNPIVFGGNVGGVLQATKPLAEVGLTRKALKLGGVKTLELAGKGFKGAKNLKVSDVKKAVGDSERAIVKLAGRVKKGDFTTPENIAAGITLFAVLRPDKLGLKGVKGLVKLSSKTLKNPAVVSAGKQVGNFNKALLKSKAGKKALTADFKKSKRIISKLRKKPSKALIRKKVQKAKLVDPVVKTKDVEPIRAFKIKEKDGFLTGIELGKGKSKRITTVRTKTKARRVITRVVEREVKVGQGQVAKKLVKVKQVQKFERITKPSLKLSQKQSQKLKQSLTGTSSVKKRVVQKIVSSSPKVQAQTFATSPVGNVKGFRSQKIKDKLLSKLKSEIKLLEDVEKKALRKFVKQVNVLIKKGKTSLKKEIKTVNKKLLDKAVSNPKTFGKVSVLARKALDASKQVKSVNDLGRKIRALSLISFKPKIISGAKPDIKAVVKPKTTPGVKPDQKINGVVRTKLGTLPKKPIKKSGKPRKKVVSKAVSKPIKFVKPVFIKKPVFKKQKLAKPRLKVFKKPSKLPKVKIPKKLLKSVKKAKVAPKTLPFTEFTPTLLSPSKNNKVTAEGKELFFTGLELR